MISVLPAVVSRDGYYVRECRPALIERERSLAYEIRRGPVLIARIALVVTDPTANAILLRGVQLIDGSSIDEVVEGLRILCGALWRSAQVERIVLFCSATNGGARQTMAGLGAVLEGVQRSVPAGGSGALDDQAQFSILRSEWREVSSHAQRKRITPQEVRLRAAETRDLSALYDLERSAFGVGYDLGHLRQFLDLFPGLVLLAEDSRGDALGYLLQAPTYHDPSTAWILSMGVRRDVQTQGIGKALLKAGIDLLRGINVRTVLLSVDPNNLLGRKIYEHAGFQLHASVSN